MARQLLALTLLGLPLFVACDERSEMASRGEVSEVASFRSDPPRQCLLECGSEYDPTLSCQCDDECMAYGDCCDDYQDLCLIAYDLVIEPGFNPQDSTNPTFDLDADAGIYAWTASIRDESGNLVHESSGGMEAGQWEIWDGSDGSGLIANGGSYEYTLSLTHAADGTVEEMNGDVQLERSWAIYIPKSFSPNGDGINDTFGFSGFGIVEWQAWIFNRWGDNIAYSESPAGSGSEIWDGTVETGEGDVMAKEDSYVYKIQVMNVFGERHTYTNHFNLIL